MCAMINLGIGKMEIDWGKQAVLSDHSMLFKPEDIKLVPHYYANYSETKDDGEHIIVEYREGFSRSLSSIKRRLDLLGYTLANVKGMYNSLVSDAKLFGAERALSFDTFSEILRDIDVSLIDTTKFAFEFDENGYDFGEYVRNCILSEKEIKNRLPDAYREGKNGLNYSLGFFLENIDPCIVLRLLAENPSCKDSDVYWAYSDLIDEWTTKEDIISPLPASKKILIVTEGTSDSAILKKAINELYPDLSDFFSFIDMKDNYPFTGTGNLYNFCCGLIKIDALNNILIILDNDSAGAETFDRLSSIPKQSNILVIKLPSHFEFEHFKTISHQGYSYENINGDAVAIECFLDFNSVEFPPIVRWISYSEKTKRYQGVLEHKEKYTKKFLNAHLGIDKYDTSKIEYLVNYIIDQWCNRPR